jgi:heptosyltransferase-1
MWCTPCPWCRTYAPRSGKRRLTGWWKSLLRPLLVRSEGLHRVIPCEIRRWRKSFWTRATRQAWGAFKAELQQEAYDAVIDLQGLTKSALVARLARLAPGGKRYALANQTDGSGYEAPTRWVADVAIALEPHIHAVRRSRELAARALGYTPAAATHFGLKSARSKARARAPEKIAIQPRKAASLLSTAPRAPTRSGR